MRQHTRRLSRFLVPALAVSLAATPYVAAAPETASVTRADQVRTALQKLGANRSIRVKLTSGKTIHGRIGPLGAQTFTLRSGRNSMEVPYNRVARIRPSPPTWLWVALGVVAGAIVVIVIALARTPAVHSPRA